MLRQVKRFFEDYKVLEHKEAMIDDMLGPDDALESSGKPSSLSQASARGTGEGKGEAGAIAPTPSVASSPGRLRPIQRRRYSLVIEARAMGADELTRHELVRGACAAGCSIRARWSRRGAP